MRLVVDLQACQSLPHKDRGIGRYSMAYTKALLRNAGSDEVWVALNGEIGDTVESVRAALSGLVEQHRIVVWRSVEETALINPANAWRHAAAAQVRKVFLARLKPDVVHVSSLFEGYYDDAVTSIDLGDSFLTSVSLYDLIPLIQSDAYLTDPRLREWYMGRLAALRRADLVLGISRFSCHAAVERLQVPGSRTIPVMAAADPIFRQIRIDAARAQSVLATLGITGRFAMYTGGIDPRKNVEGLIRAYAQLPSSLRQECQLVLVCDVHPDQRQRLQTLAAQCDLAAQELVITGYVSDENLVVLYNLCEVFVFPSLIEGFGLPPLEAMACGAPVIGSNTSSIPEVIGNEDALFDPREPATISAKLHAVLVDEDFRARLRDHGLRRARAFSWDDCARAALAAMRKALAHHVRSTTGTAVAAVDRKPLLAYVSPLPPERSGIADYSAQLLPALSEFYEVEAITDQPEVSDPWVREKVRLRTCAWFELNAERYDRILYHMGNNSLHAHTFGMLKRHPGVLVLHEVFLSGLIAHVELTGTIPDFWTRALYESHGYAALLERLALGDSAQVMERYPCSLALIRDAEGVIVHNSNCKEIAEHWFGSGVSDGWSVVPLLRTVPEHVPRAETRSRLRLTDRDVLVCCFGIINPFKLNHKLIEAWFASALGRNSHCKLVFVGGAHHDEYGQTLDRMIAERQALDRVIITGWVDPPSYRDYLAAADIAVQLRGSSRGETSATVLDCMAYGLPTIVNAHGSMVELPSDVVLTIPDDFRCVDLVGALERLAEDQKERERLGECARSYCRRERDPRYVATQYRDAVERITAMGPHRALVDLANDIAGIGGSADENDIDRIAIGIAANQQAAGCVRQLLVDVSELVRRDARSGIQRVVRRVLGVLLRHPPSGFRVEPVFAESGQPYRYARSFTMDFLGLPWTAPPDEPIDVDAEDVFLGLDLVPDVIPASRHELKALHERGVKMFFIVYDQLPLRRRDCFPPHAYALFDGWMKAIASLSDGLIAISRSVESEVREYLDAAQIPRARPLSLGCFHLGADIDSGNPNSDIAPVQRFCIDRLRRELSFLIVGTLEPRKGHKQALDAFELLWNSGRCINLILVGKPGWMNDDLVDRIRNHPESGKRLLWFEQASDEWLSHMYEVCSALLVPSEGEGFGLPLIEAAKHGLPILCRDLPVFREIAGGHACYFSGSQASQLAEAIDEWLALKSAGAVPASSSMRWRTWEQSAHGLLDVILNNHWSDTWTARCGRDVI